MEREPRYYQSEADKAIYEELLINDKCLIKMFCGSGKSLVMRKCKIVQDKELVVYVFPSLVLIQQFYDEYLNTEKKIKILKVSSDKESKEQNNIKLDNK